MDTMNVSQVLPNEVILNSAETQLYEVGLCLTCSKPTKRSKLHNPLLIFFINSISIIKIFISFFLDEEKRYYFIIIGDFPYLLGLRIHFNVASVLFILLSLSSQLIYYYNYKNDIKPNYLKVFEMMSGLVSPKSIGLTNEADIHKLIRIFKFLMGLRFYLPSFMASAAFLACIAAFSHNFSTEIFLTIGIFHSILWWITCYFMYIIIYWQLVYFCLICLYIKCRLKSMDQMINRMTVKNINRRTVYIITSFDSIYSQISSFNDNYWSKFIFWIWISLATIINTLLYSGLFGRINFVLRSLVFCAVFAFVFILLIVMNMASLVNFEANKFYKILNTLMIYSSKLTIGTRTKVSVIDK